MLAGENVLIERHRKAYNGTRQQIPSQKVLKQQGQINKYPGNE